MLNDREIIRKVDLRLFNNHLAWIVFNDHPMQSAYYYKVLARYARWLQKEESEKKVHQFWGELGAEMEEISKPDSSLLLTDEEIADAVVKLKKRKRDCSVQELYEAVCQAQISKCEAEAKTTKENILRAVAQSGHRIMVSQAECEARVKTERAKVLKEVEGAGNWLENPYCTNDPRLCIKKAVWASLKAGREKGE